MLVALGVTVWAQGNLMVGDYGVLNGQDIDWSGHDWRNRYELALWLGVPSCRADLRAQRCFRRRSSPAAF